MEARCDQFRGLSLLLHSLSLQFDNNRPPTKTYQIATLGELEENYGFVRTLSGKTCQVDWRQLLKGSVPGFEFSDKEPVAIKPGEHGFCPHSSGLEWLNRLNSLIGDYTSDEMRKKILSDYIRFRNLFLQLLYVEHDTSNAALNVCPCPLRRISDAEKNVDWRSRLPTHFLPESNSGNSPPLLRVSAPSNRPSNC